MPKIAVITDTDSSLPLELAERHHITQVPISIRFGDQSFRDAYEITSSEVFARVDREGILPKTAAPSPGEFAAVFERAFSAGAESILCLNISREVSATYDAAVLAAAEFDGRDITVIDTRQISMGQGFMALAAARAASEGGSIDMVLERALSVGQRAHLFGALSTLKYLALGGRVGQFAAIAGNMLSIRPILTVRDGKLDLLEKSRTRKRSWARVIELVANSANNRCPEQMAVLHVAAPEAAQAFAQELQSQIECPDTLLVCELSPGLAVHTGAGMVGVSFITPA